jgi:APA family basic amino acid/polyamine antiporter
MTTALPSRTIGVFGAVVTIIGFVVGASIYILPGAIGATAGPGVVLSYGIASVLALFSCVIAAQVGVAFPASGGSFIAIGRMVSPFAGFICIWMIIGAAAVAIALLGLGFTDYLATWWPHDNRQMAALGVIVMLALVNLAGVRETLSAQVFMVSAFTLALLLFSGAGLIHPGASDNWLPLMPNGIGPVIAGAVPAFFSYAGFMIIIELAGEIKNPGRAIPIALASSFLAVLALYSLTALALVGLIPWRELENINAPIAVAAMRALPAPLATFVAVTALAATVSSINVMLMAYSRDIHVLARGGVFPGFLAAVSTKRGVPVGGILSLAVLSLVALFFSARIIEYATLVVIGLLFLQIGVGLAAFKLASSPSYLNLQSSFHLSPRLLRFFAMGLMGFSFAFMVLIAKDAPKTMLLATGYLGLGVAYFTLRKRALVGTSIPLEQSLLDALSEKH